MPVWAIAMLITVLIWHRRFWARWRWGIGIIVGGLAGWFGLIFWFWRYNVGAACANAGADSSRDHMLFCKSLGGDCAGRRRLDLRQYRASVPDADGGNGRDRHTGCLQGNCFCISGF